jgi:hypothetical protein
MDYLKFLGATVLAIFAVGIGIKLIGINIGLFVIIGSTIGIFLLGPSRYAAGYIAWLVTVFLWWRLTQTAFHGFVLQNPQKYSPAEIQTAQGFWNIVGMLLLQPMCYGFARFAFGRQVPGPNTTKEGPESRLVQIKIDRTSTLRGRRNLILRFTGFVLLGLFIGKSLEYVFHIPRLPYEYYVTLCAVAFGIASVSYMIWKNSDAAKRS